MRTGIRKTGNAGALIHGLLLLLVWHAVFAAPLDTVSVTSGLIRGSSVDGIHVYRGIPYAAPPVGKLRWRPPEQPELWSGVRPALGFGPICPQPSAQLPDSAPVMSESCLVLNVWTPARSDLDSLPVMVWIPPCSGFLIGSAGAPVYDGTELCRFGVVVVSINCRLGALGFLAHPALTAESPFHASGNYGIMDEIAALQWVRTNIARFSGNPHDVTAFGESSGGYSVGILLASPLGDSLFQRGICQSGPIPNRLRNLKRKNGDLISAESIGLLFARQLKVKNDTHVLAALRSRSWKQVVGAWTRVLRQVGNGNGAPDDYSRNHMIMDGYVLTEPPGETFRAGRQRSVPLIVGTVADEGTLFTRWAGVNSPCEYRRQLKGLFGPAYADALKLYPPTKGVPIFHTEADIITDAFISAGRLMARGMSRKEPRTWVYQFRRVPGWARKLGLGSTHTAEIPYVFNHHWQQSPSEVRKLQREIGGYWTRFARTGDPNGAGAPAWPRFDSAGDQYLVLDTVITTGQHLRQAYCDFLDSLRLW